MFSLGPILAIVFLAVLGATLIWMLRLPKPLSQEVARAVFSVGAARRIVVPILDLFYTERAVELACRLGEQQEATIILAYVVEVPRLLTLDAPLPAETQKRADVALEQARQIVERHDLVAVTDVVRAREVAEGVRRTVQAYDGDMVVLGVEAGDHRMPTVFTRAAEALLRNPPCEVIVDGFPSRP